MQFKNIEMHQVGYVCKKFHDHPKTTCD